MDAPRRGAGEEGTGTTMRSALGWERFLRELDAGGAAAAAVLYGAAGRRDIRVPSTEGIGRYISLLFGGSSLALLALFLGEFGGPLLGAAAPLRQGALPAGVHLLHGGLGLAAAALFVYGVVKNAQLGALVRTVRDAVLAADR